MRAGRILILALLLAAGFYWFTTHRPGSMNSSAWFGRPDRVEITEAADGPVQLDGDEQVNVAVYKKGLPSVVNITSTTVAYNFFYGVMPQQGQGTGFIIDKAGHILTNFHVVEGQRAQIEVTLWNRKKYRAQIIGRDPAHDLAVVKIDAPDLTPAVLGDSRNLQVGQKVYAIGNPFGLAGTMTRGIVSSIRAIELGNGAPIDDAIQTDAAINPGNSGGPLLNSRGEVVGINSMIATGGVGQSAGVGFAIPINTAKAVLNDLVTLGSVRRPVLGIVGFPVSPELAAEVGLASDYGVLIMQVSPGSGAERAGLRAGTERAYIGNTPVMLGGDLLVAIDGQEINDLQDLARVMNSRRAGDTVTVTIYRGKQKRDVRVTLGEARERAT